MEFAWCDSFDQSPKIHRAQKNGQNKAKWFKSDHKAFKSQKKDGKYALKNERN